LHVTGVPLAHWPDWHVDVPLQALPSSQFVPSVTATCVTAPVPGAHASVVQGLLSSIVTGVPVKHVPFESHCSSVVHAFPSSHAVPEGRFV
jgi:hypothetical protein